jgi:antitoxin component of MazEF toxin-antitoxin module
MLTKKLQRVGGSLALVIDKPVLAVLGITEDTELEITTDGRGLHVMPKPRTVSQEAFKATADRIFKRHAPLFAKLAK